MTDQAIRFDYVVVGINIIDDSAQIDPTLTPFTITEYDHNDDIDDVEHRVLEKLPELANQNWGEGNWYGLDIREVSDSNPGIWTIR